MAYPRGRVDGAWPPDLGVVYGPPPGLPPQTRRLLHAWTAGERGPTVLAL